MLYYRVVTLIAGLLLASLPCVAQTTPVSRVSYFKRRIFRESTLPSVTSLT